MELNKKHVRWIAVTTWGEAYEPTISHLRKSARECLCRQADRDWPTLRREGWSIKKVYVIMREFE